MYGKEVSLSFISGWFKHRYQFRGSFHKPSKFPLDKFKESNVLRYVEYRQDIQDLIGLHGRLVFLDEKHLANRDTVADKV
jgi:hypothetical protein